MALLLKSGAVFLHIPKTGGTWVTQVLEECGLIRCRFSHKHADLHRVMYSPRYCPWQHAKRCLRFGRAWHAGVADAYKFCFVRHPLRWYESWWRYMKGKVLHDNYLPVLWISRGALARGLSRMNRGLAPGG